MPTFDAVDTSGTTSYTDGFQDLPGLPRTPNLCRCAACLRLYWLAVAPQLGFLLPGAQPPEDKPEWRDLPVVAGTDAAGYYQALAEGLAAFPEQELELRVFAWWCENHPHRTATSGERFPTSSEAIANLERIAELTADGDHELVLFRAEALRELGRFPEAAEALYGLCSDYDLAREKQRTLIAAGDRNVQVLFDAATLQNLSAEQEAQLAAYLNQELTPVDSEAER